MPIPGPTSLQACFLSVYTTKAAVYLLARAQPGTEYIAFMGALMAVYGVTFAVFQNDMRRLLSYHIISQVGYMVAGVGILGWLGAASEIGQLGLDGGMAHVFNHILYKTLLFMAVGVIIWKTGENATQPHRRAPEEDAGHGVCLLGRGILDLGSAALQRLRVQGDGAHGRRTDEHLALGTP